MNYYGSVGCLISVHHSRTRYFTIFSQENILFCYYNYYHVCIQHALLQAVVPLNEECGIIEWVENMQAFRAILLTIYKRVKCYMPPKDLRACQLQVKESLQYVYSKP